MSTSKTRSISVRVDADTYTRLEALRERLLDQSSKAVDAEVHRGGFPLGLVVKTAVKSLERDLNRLTETVTRGKDR